MVSFSSNKVVYDKLVSYLFEFSSFFDDEKWLLGLSVHLKIGLFSNVDLIYKSSH